MEIVVWMSVFGVGIVLIIGSLLDDAAPEWDSPRTRHPDSDNE